MARRSRTSIDSAAELFVHDEGLDVSVCGFALADPGKSKLEDKGVHDPTPTPYFVLEELFTNFDFEPDSHLLDVGCGLGRVLAYFKRAGFEGRATGIELDPNLAATAKRWTDRHDNLQVINGNALEIPLSEYTDFYLFNPFETTVLLQFICAIEAEATRPITLVHMSDNGETHFYTGRPGWTKLKSGWFDYYRNERGRQIEIYDQGQHYSAWRFDPALAL